MLKQLWAFSLWKTIGICQVCDPFDVGSSMEEGSCFDDFEFGELVEGQVSVCGRSWAGSIVSVFSGSQAFSVASIVSTGDCNSISQLFNLERIAQSDNSGACKVVGRRLHQAKNNSDSASTLGSVSTYEEPLALGTARCAK